MTEIADPVSPPKGWVTFVFLVGCSNPSPPTEDARPQPTAPTAPSTPALIRTGTSASSAAPPPIPKMPGHDENGRLLSGPGVPCAFPELGVRAAQDRCAKGERCCVTFPPDRDPSPDAEVKAVCESWSEETDQNGQFCTGWTLTCDEASDCGPGEVCCGRGGDNPLHTECKRQTECGGTILCAPGGSCPGDLLCVGPWLPWAETYRCVAPTSNAIPCGPGATCPTERPWCRWDEASRTGRCTERTPRKHKDDREVVFECFSRLSCGIGGQRCCGSPWGSACNGYCGAYFPGEEVLCASDAECDRGEKCIAVAGSSEWEAMWRDRGWGPPTLRHCR